MRGSPLNSVGTSSISPPFSREEHQEPRCWLYRASPALKSASEVGRSAIVRTPLQRSWCSDFPGSLLAIQSDGSSGSRRGSSSLPDLERHQPVPLARRCWLSSTSCHQRWSAGETAPSEFDGGAWIDGPAPLSGSRFTCRNRST